MLNMARSFFSKKNILEIDVPSISKYPSIDTHIEVMQTKVSKNQVGYLHTSPEYLMKRLLSEDIGDIYFLGHVYRKEEIGNLHNPEFTMAEWYRKDISYDMFIEETVDFIRLFLPSLPFIKKRYRETFYKYTGIDYLESNIENLKIFADKHIDISTRSFLDKDSLLHLIMTHLVEPHLGDNNLFILDNYPASQAALSQTKNINGEEVATRFEIYHKGIELANGFHELTDAKEQENRFIKTNLEREALGKPSLPLDIFFLKALNKINGNYHGVAVGFDRLLMLKHKKKSIEDIMPFSWDET